MLTGRASDESGESLYTAWAWDEALSNLSQCGPETRMGEREGSEGRLGSIEPPAAFRPYMHRPAWKLYFAGLCFWLALATWLLW